MFFCYFIPKQSVLSAKYPKSQDALQFILLCILAWQSSVIFSVQAKAIILLYDGRIYVVAY